MLAKKAADKAKKDFEERLAQEAENRRLSQIPQWKRDLIARKEEAENKLKYIVLTLIYFNIAIFCFSGTRFTHPKWKKLIT